MHRISDLETENLVMLTDFIRKNWDFSLILLIYFLIFFNNLQGGIFSVDYAPPHNGSIIQDFVSDNFRGALHPYDLLNVFLQKLGILQMSFQISVLLAMFASYYFIKKLAKKNSLLFAAIYLFNPFIYSRIMSGQLGVVIAYLLFPACIYYILALFEKEKFETRDIAKTALAFSITGSFSPQFLAFSGIAFIFASVFFYKNFKDYAKMLFFFAVIVLLLNAYLLQGLVLSPPSKLGTENLEFFAPKPSVDVPPIAKITGMWGFWREAGYTTAYSSLPLWCWYSLTALLIGLMILGFYAAAKNSRTKFVYSLWWLGILFAAGASHPVTSRIFNMLFDNLALFGSFRDSHKFVVFVVLGYAYLCPLGLEWIKEKTKPLLKKMSSAGSTFIILLFIAILIVYTFPLLGLGGQLKPTIYPECYEETNNFLLNQNISGHIIYLPWETYLTYNWSVGASSDGRISVPINKLADKYIVVGPGLWSVSDPLKDSITKCIENKSISCLESLGVQFIIKDKCALFPESYSWVNEAIALKVHTDACSTIYKLNNKIQTSIQVPLRFIFGLGISLLSLASIIFFISIKQFSPNHR